MNKQNPYGISIRLPEDIVRSLQSLKKEKELPSMTAAIKFWVEQQVSERREVELDKLRGEVKGLKRALFEILPKYNSRISEHCYLLQHILGGDHLLSRHLRETVKCKECPGVDCKGVVEFSEKGKD